MNTYACELWSLRGFHEGRVCIKREQVRRPPREEWHPNARSEGEAAAFEFAETEGIFEHEWRTSSYLSALSQAKESKTLPFIIRVQQVKR